MPPQAAAPGPLAVEYDDVVPARTGGDGVPEERLGEAIELQPTLEEVDHRMRRDRLLRRLFWILFAGVVLYLLYVFLTP